MAKANYRFAQSTNGGAILNRTLLVYERKTCYRAEVWISSFPGWHSRPHKPISVAKFYEKDGDMDLYRVCEYFGFSLSDMITE